MNNEVLGRRRTEFADEYEQSDEDVEDNVDWIINNEERAFKRK
jgi:hypothetical protein